MQVGHPGSVTHTLAHACVRDAGSGKTEGGGDFAILLYLLNKLHNPLPFRNQLLGRLVWSMAVLLILSM